MQFHVNRAIQKQAQDDHYDLDFINFSNHKFLVLKTKKLPAITGSGQKKSPLAIKYQPGRLYLSNKLLRN